MFVSGSMLISGLRVGSWLGFGDLNWASEGKPNGLFEVKHRSGNTLYEKSRHACMLETKMESIF